MTTEQEILQNEEQLADAKRGRSTLTRSIDLCQRSGDWDTTDR